MSNVKNANDLISDSVDAFINGDSELADIYLSDAIERKMTDRMVDVLSKQPEFQQQP